MIPSIQKLIEVAKKNDIYWAQREGYIGDQVMKDRAPGAYKHIQATLFREELHTY